MQPAARLAAAIEVLDDYLAGQPLEKALTNWARRSRFAGSKDRASIRDTVFDCVRCRKSLADRATEETGRGLVLAHCYQQIGMDGLSDLFSGEGHAPTPLDADEWAAIQQEAPSSWAARTNMPEWLRPDLERSLGAELDAVSSTLQCRAPVFIRVNLGKTTRKDVQAELDRAGIKCKPHPEVKTALEVVENQRRIGTSDAFNAGRIELQDAHSQAICMALPPASKMLDYCAGGGGKTLAYAALHQSDIFAHDANAARLNDIKARAARGGHSVALLSSKACQTNAPFDLVLCDVPCSGSGAWRRSPAGKWSLTKEQLTALLKTQRMILAEAAQLVRTGGCLTYVTCSILDVENMTQISWFLEAHSDFECVENKQFIPSDRGDGFFVARLTRTGSEL